MGKREELIAKLQPILHNKEQLEPFLVAHSNLPGPRSNLELAFAFASVQLMHYGFVLEGKLFVIYLLQE